MATPINGFHARAAPSNAPASANTYHVREIRLSFRWERLSSRDSYLYAQLPFQPRTTTNTPSDIILRLFQCLCKAMIAYKRRSMDFNSVMRDIIKIGAPLLFKLEKEAAVAYISSASSILISFPLNSIHLFTAVCSLHFIAFLVDCTASNACLWVLDFCPIRFWASVQCSLQAACVTNCALLSPSQRTL